jgi:hypothetical protein
MTILWVHTAISLVALVAGFVVLYGLLTSKRLDGWTAFFLLTTVLTSVTGFGFQADFQASHVVGIISLIVLLMAVLARYVFRLDGRWRWVYVIAAVVALYFNVFVGVVQAFRHIPALTALAPTESESPFAIAQVLVLIIFAVLGAAAVIRFRPAAAAGLATARTSPAGSLPNRP